MKFVDLINPVMMELMDKYEDKLSDVEYRDNQFYLYSKEKETLIDLTSSDEFKELQEDYNIGKTFDFSYDRYDGHYIVMS